MIGAVRKLWFCAGHRVYNHESKCNNLHGHNYTIYIHARPKTNLDKLGRVIDFSVLKKIANDWLDKNFDHTFLVYNKDQEVRKIFENFSQPKKIYVMESNPTAENIALHLLNDIFPDLFKDTDIEIFKIVLYETENCFVEVFN